MQTELLKPSSPKWTRLLDTIRGDVYYLPGYVAACAHQDGGEGLLFVAREEEKIWIQPLIVRPIPSTLTCGRNLFDAVSPYGYSGPLAYVANGSDFTAWTIRAAACFKECMAERNIVAAFIRLHPILNSEYDGLERCGRLRQRGMTVVVDLGRSSCDLWSDTRRGHQREINKLLRAGFIASISNDPSGVHAFAQVYRVTMQRVGASHYYFFSDRFFRQLALTTAGRLFVCTVRRNGDIAGAGLFTEMNGIVQYYLVGTADEFIRLHPSKLLVHFAISWAKERGNQHLHLGGGVGGAADSLLQFKLGYSKQLLPFHTWEMVIDRAAYSDVVEQWHARLGPSARKEVPYFPVYRASSGVP